MKKWNVKIRENGSCCVAERVIFAPSHRAAVSMGIWWAFNNMPKHWTNYRAEASVLNFGRRGY
jgi:hypothetical protein